MSFENIKKKISEVRNNDLRKHLEDSRKESSRIFANSHLIVTSEKGFFGGHKIRKTSYEAERLVKKSFNALEKDIKRAEKSEFLGDLKKSLEIQKSVSSGLNAIDKTMKKHEKTIKKLSSKKKK